MKTRIVAALAVGLLALGAAAQQVPNKPASAWPEADQPGDGKAVVMMASEGDPDGCQVTVSTRYGCEAIKCRGTHTVTFNDQRGQLTALKIAMAQAKSHMASFLKEEIAKKENTEIIDGAMKKEGGANPTAERITGEMVTTSIQTSASAILRGVVTVEQGVDANVAYTTVASSCGTRAAAGEAQRGMAQQGGGQSGQRGADASFNNAPGTTSVRRAREGF